MSRSLCVSFTFFHFISYSFPRPGKVFWLDRFFGAGVVDKKAEKWYGWAVKHVDGGRRPFPLQLSREPGAGAPALQARQAAERPDTTSWVRCRASDAWTPPHGTRYPPAMRGALPQGDRSQCRWDRGAMLHPGSKTGRAELFLLPWKKYK